MPFNRPIWGCHYGRSVKSRTDEEAQMFKFEMRSDIRKNTLKWKFFDSVCYIQTKLFTARHSAQTISRKKKKIIKEILKFSKRIPSSTDFNIRSPRKKIFGRSNHEKKIRLSNVIELSYELSRNFLIQHGAIFLAFLYFIIWMKFCMYFSNDERSYFASLELPYKFSYNLGSYSYNKGY